MPDDLRVLVVADNPLARTGLAALLAQEPGCTVVGQAGDEDDVSAALDLYRPDALVWDLGWNLAPALEKLADLRGAPVVALLADVAHAPDALPSVAGGARALLPRDVGGPRLVAAIRAVVEGLVVLDPALARTALGAGGPLPAPPAEELTRREREVLQLMAEGLSNKAIAGRLGISEHTVKFHVNAILNKLGAQSRTDAVVRATRLGLIIL